MPMTWASLFASGEWANTVAKASTERDLARFASQSLGKPVSVENMNRAIRRARDEGTTVRTVEPVTNVEAAGGTAFTEAHRLRKQLSIEQARGKELIAELASVEDRLATMIEADSSREMRKIERRERSAGSREACAVALASDWHVEETVDPATIDGRNEYSPEIATRRAEKFFQGLGWLVEYHRRGFDLRDVVLWLGGDIISGYIHEELTESNAMSPTQAIVFAESMVAAGIEMLLQDSEIDTIRVPCSYGNHGRTTIKRRISTGARNSFEWLMYHSLARRFAKEPRVVFQVAEGDHTYLGLYDDATMRFTHGDNFRSSGGISGPLPAIQRGLAKLETFRHADVTCVGHFHQYLDASNLVVNGSLIGYNAYAMHINAGYEPPRQAFFLWDAKRGKVQSTPIWVTSDDHGA